jgi:hypothetical protein
MAAWARLRFFMVVGVWDNYRESTEVGKGRYEMAQGKLLGLSLTCPNGHTRDVAYSVDILRTRLADGSLRYWCFECDTFWHPSDIEKQNLNTLLEQHY